MANDGKSLGALLRMWRPTPALPLWSGGWRLVLLAMVLFPPEVFPSASGGGEPADVRLQGHLTSWNGLGQLNGVYVYKGKTADGKNYYSHSFDTGAQIFVVYLFYDKDCDGENSALDELKEQWFIDT